MRYRWTSKKPLQRGESLYERKDQSLASWRTVPVSPGETFEPTEAEVRAFGDLMQLVDEEQGHGA